MITAAVYRLRALADWLESYVRPETHTTTIGGVRYTLKTLMPELPERIEKILDSYSDDTIVIANLRESKSGVGSCIQYALSDTDEVIVRIE